MNYPIMLLNKKKQADHFIVPTYCVKMMILIIWFIYFENLRLLDHHFHQNKHFCQKCVKTFIQVRYAWKDYEQCHPLSKVEFPKIIIPK